jgi:hypothetical protein
MNTESKMIASQNALSCKDLSYFKDIEVVDLVPTIDENKSVA